MVYQSNIYEFLENGGEAKELLLCKDDKEAVQIRDVALLLGFDTYVLPDIRVSVGEDLRAYTEDIQAFFAQLFGYEYSKKKKILIAPVRTVLLPFPKPQYFSQHSLEFGDTVNLAALKEQLYHWGYHFTDIAAGRGEVSFRGDIIDIFPIDAEKPYRISLFDDEIESIQQYDEATQKRFEEELEGLTFTAVRTIPL